jgi:hypothetical protein
VLNIAKRQLEGPYGPYRTTYKKSVLGNLERLAPGEKFVREMISPPQNPRTYPEDVTRLGRLMREIGVLPIGINQDTRGGYSDPYANVSTGTSGGYSDPFGNLFP